MYIAFLVCWLVFLADSISMRCFRDEIKPKAGLKAFVVYLWLGSLALGVFLGISIIFSGVSKWIS